MLKQPGANTKTISIFSRLAVNLLLTTFSASSDTSKISRFLAQRRGP